MKADVTPGAWGLQSRRSLRFKTETPQKDPFVPFLFFFIFLFRLRDSRHTCLKASLHSNSLVIYCAWMASTASHLYLILRVLLSFLPFSVGPLPLECLLCDHSYFSHHEPSLSLSHLCI
jgi:hypothetical protein